MSIKRNMGSFLQHGILCMLPLCAMIGAVTGDMGYYVKDSRTKIPELKKIECDKHNMHIVQINGVPFCECVDNGHYLVLRSQHDAEVVEYGDAICVPLDCSKISQHMNLVTKDDGTQECRCDAGYFLHQRNRHDPDTGRCTRCTNCSTTDKPYQAMPCYKSSDSLCCSSPDMIAQEVSQGFYDCFLSDCSKISQHMNLVTKDDGKQECRCEDGYYLHQRNVHDPDTGRCTRCTNCSTTDKPYEAMPCYKSIDALCCSSRDMKAQEVSLGFYDCVQPKTRLTTTTTTTTTTTSTTKAPPNTQQSLDITSTKEKYDVIISGCNGPRMNVRVNKDGSNFCECEDKSPAKKEGKEFVCDGKEESKDDDTAVPVYFIVTFYVMILVFFIALWNWNRIRKIALLCQRYCSKLHKKRESEYSLACSHSQHSPETSGDETSM